MLNYLVFSFHVASDKGSEEGRSMDADENKRGECLKQAMRLIDAHITERTLAYHERLVKDYGLEPVKPKSNTVTADQSLQEGA